MDSRRYCVYNQSNECFLSLGVAAARTTMERVNGMLEKRRQGNREGYWIERPGGVDAVGVFVSRDLIYLDDGNKVVHTIESIPPMRLPHYRGHAASVLALPPGAIQSSQTVAGNQLVVCEAEEMVFRLRGGQKPEPGEPEVEPHDAEVKDRRISWRRRWPHLAAYDAEGESLALRGIRDISTTGLYVLTRERWPIGTQVRLSLQRTDGLDDSSMIPTTVELRVSRWGEDGVGLEFVKTNPEHAALVSAHVR